MARKRFLAPDIWSDSYFKKLSPQERLLFIGMITLADDEGRLLASPAYLKGQIFPDDGLTDLEVAALRDRLARRKSSVYLYKVSGNCFVFLPKWSRYQAPSHPSPSRLPAPPRFKNSQKAREDFVNVSGGVHDLGMGVGRGKGSGSGMGKGSGSSPPKPPSPDPAASTPEIPFEDSGLNYEAESKALDEMFPEGWQVQH
jgi:hypothetical protein